MYQNISKNDEFMYSLVIQQIKLHFICAHVNILENKTEKPLVFKSLIPTLYKSSTQ